MKGILCGLCVDFRALTSHGPVSCRCGNVTGWWVDPHRGIAKVYAKSRDYARIVGIHNDFLHFAFETHYDWSSDKWKAKTEQICREAEGYVFHESLRNCPVAIIGVGATNDTSWADEPPAS